MRTLHSIYKFWTINMKLINMICTYKNKDECGGKWREVPSQYTGAALPPLRLSSPQSETN
jgi:hypothetical protein